MPADSYRRTARPISRYHDSPMPSGRHPVPLSLGIKAARDVAHSHATDRCNVPARALLQRAVKTVMASRRSS